MPSAIAKGYGKFQAEVRTNDRVTDVFMRFWVFGYPRCTERSNLNMCDRKRDLDQEWKAQSILNQLDKTLTSWAAALINDSVWINKGP